MPYTIKQGDSLSRIAQANNTTVDQLLALNPTISNPNLIRAGASLNLPGGQPVAPGPAAVSSVTQPVQQPTPQAAATFSTVTADSTNIKDSLAQQAGYKDFNDLIGTAYKKTDSTQTYSDLRDKAGLTQLEAEINQATNQLNERLDSIKQDPFNTASTVEKKSARVRELETRNIESLTNLYKQKQAAFEDSYRQSQADAETSQRNAQGLIALADKLASVDATQNKTYLEYLNRTQDDARSRIRDLISSNGITKSSDDQLAQLAIDSGYSLADLKAMREGIKEQNAFKTDQAIQRMQIATERLNLAQEKATRTGTGSTSGGAKYATRLNQEVNNVFSGRYGSQGAREKAIALLQREFPGVDVAGDIYSRVPDNSPIKSSSGSDRSSFLPPKQ